MTINSKGASEVKARETVHDKTIRELSQRIKTPDAARLVELAAAYRAAGEEQEALTLISLSHLVQTNPDALHE